ncbi:MAG: hypothetical protein JG782_679 [Anaerophaga sp.]|uniref:hypothetical protein n=1 Tax=Anaerophaga thermohalophila TaxID=177400 RepID=UPI000237D377|nr:hypothetical protein [Anaerophaga thermohalophila]MBZ4676060.1 hypothetical protein [Anaerophaga sp.]MDK2841022.1 hypothetical protein [Anaerophaga sp.]
MTRHYPLIIKEIKNREQILRRYLLRMTLDSFVILSEAKNLISGEDSLNDKKQRKERVVTRERFFVVPPQNNTGALSF